MQTTKRATRAQLHRVQRRQATERERAERARRMLTRHTRLTIDGVRHARTVAEIHNELTRPVVGPEFALQTARQLAQTLQRLAARSLLTTPTTRGYPAEVAALCANLEHQQPPHPRCAIDCTTERAAETLIDQVLAASQTSPRTRRPASELRTANSDSTPREGSRHHARTARGRACCGSKAARQVRPHGPG
jgi:hypothetical protein